jgi:hypothetical protein
MNTANHIPQDDLALFALQLMTEQETADALLHLEHCEACREEVARYQGDLAAYSMTSEMHSPPAMARERLMRRVAKEKKLVPVDRTPQAVAATSAASEEPFLAPRRGMFETETYDEAPRRRGTGFATWAGWAIAAGVAVVAGMQFHQRQLLQSNLNDVSAKLSQTAGDATRAQQVLQALTDSATMHKTLQVPQPEGVPASHLPEGHAAYEADKGALVFVATNLLPLPAYKTYELWVIPPKDSGRQPVPAGIFKPDSKGDASVVMPDIPKGEVAAGFAVTIEDDGGTKQPTLPIVLVGM